MDETWLRSVVLDVAVRLPVKTLKAKKRALDVIGAFVRERFDK